MPIQSLVAERTARMRVNAIREILKVVSQPGGISLAGGIPAPESFPMDIIRELTRQVIDTYGSTAFQYGPTEGFAPLRHHLAERLIKMKDIQATPENVFISSGSQGALDAVGKILISKGDKIGVASPTYLGAIQAFDPYESDSGSKQQCCGHEMPSQKDDNPRQISTGYYLNNYFNRDFSLYFKSIQLKQWTGPVPRTTGDQSHKSYYWKLFFMPKRNSRKPMDGKNWP